MKRRNFDGFWIGFVIAAAVVASVYLFWRRQQLQMQMPGVLSLGRAPGGPSAAQSVAGSVAAEVAQTMASVANHHAKGRPAPATTQAAKSGFGGVAAGPPGPDRLELIKGIGPVYARRLNDAGIRTYAQLAAQPPAHLAEITMLRPWQSADPADWIAAAQRLAG